MNNSKLSCFVHVPKTAGSSVNTMLAECAPGSAHVESFLDNRGQMRQILKDSQWVSGHVNFDVMRNLALGSGRPVDFFSSVREPSKQVMSHFNWLFEIYYRGESFYNSHPVAIKSISEDLRTSNRSDPRSIISLLEKYRGLFMNCQSKFIFGNYVKSQDDIDEKVLRNYEFVSNGSDIESLVFKMTGKNVHLAKSNVSRYHFDPQIFDLKEVRDFLASENQLDCKLYDLVCEIFN